MYPILYAANETDFTTQGIGVLSECTKAFVTEELNGMFEFEFRYPQSGVHFSEIHHSSIVKVTPCENGTPQLFRVYRIQEPISGICVINCEHISYQLNFIPCNAFTASNVASALAGFATNAWETCPFSFTTDKSTVAEYKQKIPEAIRARLGGQEGSILDVYGGEYEFDNYTVHLWNKRGSVRDVTLRYGKNITDIMQEENIEKTITGICPYWSQTSIDDNDQEVVTTVVLPEHVIHSEASQNFPFQRTAMVDFSSEWQEAPTVAQLRARAQQYIERNNIGVPSVSIDISFVALWNTEEYKDIAPLERVRLGDTIGVYFEPLNISAEARIVKTVWNPLLERYDSVQVGDAKSTFAKSIIEDIPTDDDIDDRIDDRIPSVMDEINKEIEENSERITGGLGGYVKFTYNANGEPEEILIMNTDNVATAQYIIRMNRAGIGFSTHGYEGPYTSAWVFDTQNGVQRFNADFITAGTLTANIIRAGILQDIAGKNWWNLGTGAFSFANGNFLYDPASPNYIDLINKYTLRFDGIPLMGETSLYWYDPSGEASPEDNPDFLMFFNEYDPAQYPAKEIVSHIVDFQATVTQMPYLTTITMNFQLNKAISDTEFAVMGFPAVSNEITALPHFLTAFVFPVTSHIINDNSFVKGEVFNTAPRIYSAQDCFLNEDIVVLEFRGDFKKDIKYNAIVTYPSKPEKVIRVYPEED